MAALLLKQVVISLVSDLSKQVACYSSTPPQYADVIEGEVRSYGGRRRILLGDDQGVSFSQTLRQVSLADVDVLRSWKGLPVLYRDKWGVKVYGTYLNLSPQASKTRATWDVAINFTESTVYELAP